MQDAWRVLLEGAAVGSVYALIAVGLGLVFGVLNFVNLAHGEVVVVAAYVTLLAYDRVGSYVPAAAIGLVVASLFGVLLYAGALQFVAQRSHFTQIVFTLALVLLLQNAYLLVFGAEPKQNPMGQNNIVDLFGSRILTARLIAGGIGAILIVAVAVTVARTNFGRSVRAIAASAFGAQITGVNLRRTGARAFVLGTVLAAAAGVLISPFTIAETHSGLDLTIRAFVVVIIASTGSVMGILVTGLGVGIIETIGLTYMPVSIANTLVYIAIIPLLLFRPNGLFAKRVAR